MEMLTDAHIQTDFSFIQIFNKAWKKFKTKQTNEILTHNIITGQRLKKKEQIIIAHNN